jgi:hypothetical protein
MTGARTPRKENKMSNETNASESPPSPSRCSNLSRLIVSIDGVDLIKVKDVLTLLESCWEAQDDSRKRQGVDIAISGMRKVFKQFAENPGISVIDRVKQGLDQATENVEHSGTDTVFYRPYNQGRQRAFEQVLKWLTES